jgi:hypothetical protein
LNKKAGREDPSSSIDSRYYCSATMTDEMRRTMDYTLASIDQLEVKLRKTEQSLLSKIEAQQKLREKLTSRREFYEKMQTNIEREEGQALSKFDAAEKARGVFQQNVDALELELHSSKAALDEVVAQNKLNVLPELERLGNLLQATKDEIEMSSRACADDEQRLQELGELKNTLDTEDRELKQSAKLKEDLLSPLRALPGMHAEKLARARQDAVSIQLEIDGINQCKMIVQAEIARQTLQISKLHEQKNAESDKLQYERNHLEERRIRVDELHKQLASQRISQHDLAAESLEIELRIKNSQDEVKHNSNFLTAENRQLPLAKSALIKKQQALSMLQSSLPLAEAKLQELQQSISTIKMEKQADEHMLSSIKARVDSCIMNLVSEEYVEKDILERLHASSKAVAERECEIEQARIEENKANTLLFLIKEKGAITRRKIEQLGQLKSDVDMEIHVQEIRKLDLTKKINNAEKKRRDFATLLEMTRGEKEETSSLINETQKSLSEMNKRSESLQADIAKSRAERDLKMKTLEGEIDARVVAQQRRATKRTEKSEAWSCCRQALEDVERHDVQIDKLKATLSNSKRELERATLQNEQLTAAKESMSRQMQLRKKQLEELQITANTYTETLKKGELGIQQKEKDRAATERKNIDLQRSIDLSKKGIQNSSGTEEKIESVRKKIEVQVLESELLSRELENPNQDRLRVLDAGEDPSEEELAAKIATLERLVLHKNEVLLAGEISSNEAALRVRQLEETVKSYKISTQTILQDINEYQARVQEKQRFRTAHMSEIRMYEELIAARTSKISDLEHDILLREEIGENEHKILRTAVESSTDSPSPLQTKRKGCERPTGYLPGDYDETMINVPRPYGALAPFKAGVVKKVENKRE